MDKIDPAADVLFAVLVFRTNSAHFFCGAGNWKDLYQIVLRREPDQPILFERTSLVEWIGQDWE